MKKTAVLLLLIASFVLPAMAQDSRDFWLLNNSGREIDSVFVARHGTSDTWGDDILGIDTLVYGRGTKIVFTGGRTTCLYDFRLVFTDGSAQEYMQGRNLCTSVAVTFNRDTNASLN